MTETRMFLTEEMLRKRLAEQLSADPPEGSVPNPYEGIDLMALPTDEIFVTEAYRRVLGRSPNIDGLHHFTEVLRSHPRQFVLDALIACVPRPQEQNSPSSPSLAGPIIVDVTVLGKLESAEQFVCECYSKILGRDVDPSGLKHYRLLLALGVSRVQVMGLLAMSEEGKRRDQKLLWQGNPLPLQPLSLKHRLLLRLWEAMGICGLEDGISSLRASTAGIQSRQDGLREELNRIATNVAAAELQGRTIAERQMRALAATERLVETEHESAQEVLRLKEEVARLEETISRQNRYMVEQFRVLNDLRELGHGLIGQIEGITSDIRIRQEAMAEAQQRSVADVLAKQVEAERRAEANLAAVANDIRIGQKAMAEAQQRSVADVLARQVEAEQRAETNLAAVANDIRVRQEAMAEAQQRGVAGVLARQIEAQQRAEANLADVANDIRIRQEATAAAQERIGGEITVQLGGLRERADELLAAIRPPILQTDNLFILRVSNLLLGIPREDVCLAALYAHWGSVDLGVSRWITSNVQPGMIFADIGANIGLHTLEAARAVGPSGKVFSFEPAPETLVALRANLALNGVRHAEVFPVAVMDRPGPVRLHLNRGNGSLNSIFPDEETSESIEVPGLPLDEALAGRDRVDVVKIDAEGAEFLILHGMTNVLARNPNIVLLLEFASEHLSRAGVNGLEYLAYLRSLGFRIRRIDEVTGDVLPVEDQQLLEAVSNNVCLDRAERQ
jgi:FkbM family methyltransferase